MTTVEKREKETHLFTNRLNQEKSYFKGFAGKYEGIAEAEALDEQSVRQDTERAAEETKEKTIEQKEVMSKGSQSDNSDSNDDDDSSDSDKNSQNKAADVNSQNKEGEDAEDDEEAEDLEAIEAAEEAARFAARPENDVNNINNYYGADGILRNEAQREKEDNYRMAEKPLVVKSLKKWRKLEIRKLLSTG